jgi:ABC-type nitrate/sulfonate/bicarbonate transport system ATPase subunit
MDDEQAVRVTLKDIEVSFSTSSPLFSGLNATFESRIGGHVVAVMGKSGMGKSTLCNLMLGIIKPQCGSVETHPRNATTAFVSQRPVLFEELSVAENVCCLRYSRTLGATFSEDRYRDAMRTLGIDALVSRPVGKLSVGEGQRVMIARIHSVDSDIVFLDEPCIGLDSGSIDELLWTLRELVSKRSSLAFIVTHSWSEAACIANTIVYCHRPCVDGPTQVVILDRDKFYSTPPDLDAFLSIHWPRCVIWDITTAGESADLSSRLPERTRYVCWKCDNIIDGRLIGRGNGGAVLPSGVNVAEVSDLWCFDSDGLLIGR